MNVMTEQLPNFSRLACLLADASRARMLCALMDNSRLTASQLAITAGLSPQSTSNHLAKLIHCRVVAFDKIGRNRYYRLHNSLIAQAIESMMVATYADSNFQERLKPSGFKKMCYARTCYDHIAGHVSVAIYEHLCQQKVLEAAEGNLAIGTTGDTWFGTHLGIDVNALRHSRRALVIPCMDWSEQSYHLSGELGAHLFSALLKKRFIIKTNEARILTLTPAGKAFLQRSLGIHNIDDE
jgi:DNA-binding transcriptional ArsR family regulator